VTRIVIASAPSGICGALGTDPMTSIWGGGVVAFGFSRWWLCSVLTVDPFEVDYLPRTRRAVGQSVTPSLVVGGDDRRVRRSRRLRVRSCLRLADGCLEGRARQLFGHGPQPGSGFGAPNLAVLYVRCSGDTYSKVGPAVVRPSPVGIFMRAWA
jgi:hypothetical protein